MRGRRLIGWALGFLVSMLGLSASFAWDLPTGAAVVAAFGVLMVLVAMELGVRRLIARVREQGWRARAAPGAFVSLVIALACWVARTS